MTEAPPPAKNESKEKEEAKEHSPLTPVRIAIIVGVVVVLAVLGVLYYLYASQYESTDDAYTTGRVHVISSRVTGTVTAVLVNDNQHVRAGDVLVQLDPRDYQVVRDRALAQYQQAQADFERVDALRGDVAISKQDYDQTSTTGQVNKSALNDANNQLSYCTITAPTDGYIGNRQVEVGNRVQVGGALMSVVQGLWVVANYKETQVGLMRRGQHASVSIDAVPNHTFKGWVDSFSPGTGATFALLPPDNATGNFTKIVQRVPVKIIFDPADLQNFPGLLVPGMSCEPVVDLKTPPQANLPPSP